MLSLLKKSTDSYIGVDISYSHIKMVELSGDSTNIKVERYCIEYFPGGTGLQTIEVSVDTLGESLLTCWRQLKSRSKTIALALPPALVTTKTFLMASNLNSREQFEQAESEVLAYVPFDRADIYFDFQIVGPSETPDIDKVFLAVTKQKNIEDLVNAALFASLTPAVVEIETHATVHALNEMISSFDNDAKDEYVVVVDIGSDHSNFLLTKNLELIEVREINTSGAGLRSIIQNNYGLNPVEADDLIRSPEMFQERFPSYEADILLPFLEGQALEIGRQINFFDAGGHGPVKGIVLCGGTASLVGLDDTVKGRLDIETVVANPMLSCQLSSNINPGDLLNDAPRLMVAFGLALRSFK